MCRKDTAVMRWVVLATVVAHIFGGTPAAVDSRAEITHVPPGVEARIVDGNRLWLRLPNGQVHEHRLYAVGGRWRVPAYRVGIVSGTLVRLSRPAFWPWVVLGLVLAAAAAAAFRWKRVAIAFPVLTLVASVTAYAGHTGSLALLVVLPIAGAVALAGLLPKGTRLPAVLLIGAFGVYTGIALAPMIWRALPLTSLPSGLARATVVISLVAGVATCLLYVLSAPATYRERSAPSHPS
jgi:hypothetical protein